MFKPGNKLGRGRPNISLNKPELLLPIIFLKGKVNWANDFIEIYKAMKKGVATQQQKDQFKLYLELMPYLCTKVNVKDLDFSKYGPSDADKKSMTDQTAALLEALENVNAKPTSPSKEAGLADGPSQVPPTA